MKILDSMDGKITMAGDRVMVPLPPEYEGLAGFGATVQGAVEDGRLVFLVRPDLDGPVRETVGTLWGDLRLLFSGVADVGPDPPWDDMVVVWEAREAPEEKAHGGKVPVAAAEVLEHRRIYHTKPLHGDRKDVRRGIFDTMTRLCVMASRHLGFKSQLFSMAFGEAVASMFCQVGCTYGAADVICNVFAEEFANVYPDRFWSLTSERSREAMAACYRKVKYLEDDPQAFEKEKERVMRKWSATPHP